MQLTTSPEGITTREDGLLYDVKKIAFNEYQFRAIANPAKPHIIFTSSYFNAINALVAIAPEDKIQASINTLTKLLTKSHFSNTEKNQMRVRIAELESQKIGA